LGRHDGAQGRAYRAFYVGLVKDLGPFEPGSLLAHQAAQVAALWVRIEVDHSFRDVMVPTLKIHRLSMPDQEEPLQPGLVQMIDEALEGRQPSVFRDVLQDARGIIAKSKEELISHKPRE
jgi:hypothetical protein